MFQGHNFYVLLFFVMLVGNHFTLTDWCEPMQLTSIVSSLLKTVSNCQNEHRQCANMVIRIDYEIL